MARSKNFEPAAGLFTEAFEESPAAQEAAAIPTVKVSANKKPSSKRGRPASGDLMPDEERERTSVILTKELIKKVKIESAKTDKDQSEIVRIALRQYFEQQKD